MICKTLTPEELRPVFETHLKEAFPPSELKPLAAMEDLRRNVEDVSNENQVREYLYKLLNKEAFDRSGLIYGMGHAVYSISDPRAKIFKAFVEKLANEKKRHAEFELYSMIERMAPEVIAEKCRIYKGVSANVDFYSGFVYTMLGIPRELFTPIFAVARISGWCAHRLEELVNDGKIIRLAFPQLTEERRKELVKQIAKYAEGGKVAIRNIRRDAVEEFKAQKKNSEITEDDMKIAEKDIQKLTDDMCKEIDELLAKKEKELLAV